MDYIEVFKNLKTSNKHGRKSPEKAVLLLSIIDIYEKQQLESNEIKYNDILTSTYLKIWNKIFPNETIFISNSYVPFWQLQNDSFWHIVPNRGKDDILTILADTNVKPSELKILECVKYAELDDDLYFEMTLPSSRSALKRVLLEEYTKLSSSTINRMCEIDDSFEDKSIEALDQYTKILSNNSQNVEYRESGIKTSNSYYSTLNEDVRIVINIQYFTFLKIHKQERDLIKEVFSDVVDLCNKIKDSSVSQSDFESSVLFLYEDFLYNLKIELMSEDGAEAFISYIEKSIDRLRGVETKSIIDSGKNEENSSSPKIDDFEAIKEKIDSYDLIHSQAKPVYTIKNEDNECSIIDQIGEIVYKTTGKFKSFNGIIYRCNLKPICFTVKRMIQVGDKWEKSGKLITLFKESPLFKILKPDYYLDQIYDIKENPIQINIEGKWYNFAGDLLSDSKETESDYRDESSRDDQSCRKKEIKDFQPKFNLSTLKEIATSSFDFLWILAIVDFVSESQHQSKLTYDEIAIKVISYAWVILSNHSELREQEPLIAECIDYLIDEFKNTDEELSINNSCSEVFEAIKDYPMCGVYEDCVNCIIENTPFEVLKIWLDSKNRQDFIFDSMEYQNDCMYAIYQKKLDPYIVLNPNIIRYLYRESENLKEYFINQYIEFWNDKTKEKPSFETETVEQKEERLDAIIKEDESKPIKVSIPVNEEVDLKSSIEEPTESKQSDIIVNINVKEDTFDKIENGETTSFKKGIIDNTVAEQFLENPQSPFAFYTRVTVCPLKARHIDYIKFIFDEKVSIKKVKGIRFSPGKLGLFKEVWIANIEFE